MSWLPLSVPITSQMTVYKNIEDKRPQIENTRNFQAHGIYESTLHLPMHTGTHIDYPLHAVEGGKISSDYSLFPAFFKAYVLDLSENTTGKKLESIGLEHLQSLNLSDVEALFFKTLNEPMNQFDFEFPRLNKEGAAYLSTLPLKFVGIDQLGIERNQPDHMTHISLLSQDVLIIEGLNLTPLETGVYDFAAFSLGVEGVEAEPLMVYALV